MPIWMLPFVAIAWLFAAVTVTAVWLALQILRLVGLGGVAAVRSVRQRREAAAVLSMDPAVIAKRGAVERRRGLEEAERSRRRAAARERIPNILPMHWAWRTLIAGWAVFWFALGLHDALSALSAGDRTVVGPILGPFFVVGVSVALPLWIARAIRRRRVVHSDDRLGAGSVSGQQDSHAIRQRCGHCGADIEGPARFCPRCGAPMDSGDEVDREPLATPAPQFVTTPSERERWALCVGAAQRMAEGTDDAHDLVWIGFIARHLYDSGIPTE
jgi:hypothetical protein